MTKLRLLLGLLGVLSVVGVASATAAPGTTCAGGAIAAGSYGSLTVTGNCWFSGAPTASITINGNLVVAPGAVLNDHAGAPPGVTQPLNIHVTGNVLVGSGAVLGLGTYNPFAVHNSTVDGSLVADAPLSLYVSFTTVHGNFISNGGGGGATGEFRNFPTKDDTVDGNLIIQGWTGGWIGIIRDHVGGNVVFSNNTSVLTFDEETGMPVPGTDPDSSEVATNVIGGNLICQNNTPGAQLGDSGGVPNVVGGRKIGQCSGL
jgi:hypothetical protein